jgi:hypothetical protein
MTGNAVILGQAQSLISMSYRKNYTSWEQRPNDTLKAHSDLMKQTQSISFSVDLEAAGSNPHLNSFEPYRRRLTAFADMRLALFWKIKY